MTGPATTRRSAHRRPEMSVPRFVSRVEQLRQLAEGLSRPPAVVFVEGEAGIGKSRLVQELLAGAGHQRALVGYCPPYREPSTLAPVVDGLRQARERVAGLGLSELGGALRPLFPEWAADLPPAPDRLVDATAARNRLFRALAELVGCLGVTVLVVEDVHWADEVSLEFLLFLATHEPGPGPASIVVTYRPEDVPPGSLLLRLPSQLPAGVSQRRVALPPLGVADTAELVSSMLDGAPVSETFAEFLHRRTDGVPLAVEESVRLLGDRADLVHHHGEWVRRSLAGLEVPPTVRDSTLERLQRLAPPAQRILRAAAVLGEPADRATLVAVAGAGEGVATAVASRLLTDLGGRLAFRHVLPAAAVYETVPGPERRELHRRSGAALAQREPPPEAQLARHFREANEVEDWAHWAERAADTATDSSDYPAAVALLDGLVEVDALPVPVRVRLARKLAAAALFVQVVDDDRGDRVLGSLRSVVDLPELDPRLRAELRNLRGRLLNQQGDHAAGFVEMTRAIRHLDHVPAEAATTMISLGWPQAGPWPASVHLRWLRRAERLMTAVTSPADRLGLLVDRAAALLQLGAEQGWTLVADLPDEVPTMEERIHLVRGYLNLGDIAMYWGRYDEARRLLTAACERAAANQFTRIGEIAQATLLRLDWLTGRWDGLGARVTALTGASEIEPAARQEALLVAGLAAAANGGYGAADRQLRAVLEFAQPRGAVHLEVGAAAGLARLWLADGRVEDARQVTDGPMRMLTHRKIWLWCAELAPVRVAALLAAGQADEAGRLVADLTRVLQGRDAPAPRAALATSRAILAAHRGEHTRAQAAFARAIRAWEALPRPYEALLTWERRALSLLAADRSRPGTGLLSQVHDGLRALGAAGDADRVAARMRRLGMEVTRPWRGGRRGYGNQLSPREQEVVRLVATGKTNREIAQELSKAPGTVAEQLRSAMRKLGVTSRTAVAVSALTAGVIPDHPEPR